MPSPVDRFTRVANGELQGPGACICGTISGDYFVDTGMHLEYYGVVYLCATCAISAAELFGGLNPVNEEGLRRHIKELDDTISLMSGLLEEKEKLNESYRLVIANLSNSAGVDSDDASSSDPEPVTSEPSDGPEIIGLQPFRDPERTEPADASDNPLSDLIAELNDTDSESGEPEDSTGEASESPVVAAGVASQPATRKAAARRATTGRLLGES